MKGAAVHKQQPLITLFSGFGIVIYTEKLS